MHVCKKLTVWNTENKRSFNVRLVMQSDHYGREMCLTHNERDPLVEFYDASNDIKELDGSGVVLGQFVSRYYLSTLVGKYDGSQRLCLDCGNEDIWSINASNMKNVSDWLVDIANFYSIKINKLEINL